MTDSVLSARLAALDILGAVLHRHRPLDEALDDHHGFADLDVRDRAFARNLVSTTLRRLGQVDDLIKRCLDRPLPHKARGVTDILRLGIVQLLFTRTPPHAAVDSAVNLCRARGFDSHVKLVNAVLRRIDREGRGWPDEQNAAWLNTPSWLWQSWLQSFGGQASERIANAHLQEPPLDITVATDPELWAERLSADILPTGSLRISRETLSGQGAVPSLPGFEDGAWWVQDAAAAIPVRLLGDVTGKSVIDLCAAPGGKTAQLAAAGARVIAVERSEKRLGRLKENLQRLHLSAETVTADAGVWQPDELADAVLLDAPCTATGTIRRHPDILHLKNHDDAVNLGRTQDRMLANAFQMIKPGGVMIFCTCSLQPEEGPDRIAAFLAGNSDARRRPIRAEEVGDLTELLSAEGDLRTLPCHLADVGGMDGFYAARLERR